MNHLNLNHLSLNDLSMNHSSSNCFSCLEVQESKIIHTLSPFQSKQHQPIPGFEVMSAEDWRISRPNLCDHSIAMIVVALTWLLAVALLGESGLVGGNCLRANQKVNKGHVMVFLSDFYFMFKTQSCQSDLFSLSCPGAMPR